MQLVVFKLGQGSWQSGFPSVIVQQVAQTSQMAQSAKPALPTQFLGSLPAAAKLAALYEQWRALYAALNQRLNLRKFAIEIEAEGVTNVSLAALEAVTQQLKQALDQWLEAESFRKVERRLRTQLATTDEIRVVIETEDPLLRRFPWQLWSFFDDYPFAEMALSVAEYGQVQRTRTPSGKVRILAVLGNSEGIDIQQDRAVLEQLSDADVVFLVEPSRSELDQQLWDQQGWDIFFFAGHSTSQADASVGEMAINPSEFLTIAQLKNALTAAIQRGLQFAIFNSCDGLGLARRMADLNIPQLVVMREPVPDRVAQTFLKHLLTAFAAGQSFYLAVREARAKLQGLENQFPCASYLPVICQNPTETPASWRSLVSSLTSSEMSSEMSSGTSSLSTAPISLSSASESSGELQSETSITSEDASRATSKRTLKLMAVTSLAVTSLVMTLRWLGGLQGLELFAFDQMLRLRPAEVADPRILVVEVTQEDTNEYGYPLQDKTLATAIEKLAAMQPRAIGVDMHRYQPRGEGRAQLLQQFQAHDHLFTVCWFGSSDKNFAPPPEFTDAQRINQVGFSDLLLDGNETGPVRRQILSYDPQVASSPPDCATPYSFSFQLAFRYLHDQNIQPLTVDANGNWQFGEVTFGKLPARFVGYQDLDGLSSQIMLNYRQALPGQRVTLQQVLQNQISRNFVEDRIVLLGTTAPIARDSFSTPLGEQAGIWVHAHQISQILSAVLNQRTLIWGLPQTGAVQWGDAIWVVLWAGVGSGAGWYFRAWRWLLLANSIAVVLLYQLCLVALIAGAWLPFVPATLALLGSSTTERVLQKSGRKSEQASRTKTRTKTEIE